MSASEVGAWVAVVIAVSSVVYQGLAQWRVGRKERSEVQMALEKNPLIKEQLAIGNVSAAVAELNTIILSQAAHIDRQEKRIQALEDENEELRRRFDRREEELILAKEKVEKELLTALEQIDDLKGLIHNQQDADPHNPHS